MNRLASYAFNPAIKTALQQIPQRFHRFLNCDLLCGYDPIYVGLFSFENTSDGRSYHNTACCAYPYHQSGISLALRATTVVMPKILHPLDVIHELGHVLQYNLDPDFELQMKPVTTYSETDNLEAFAEAFTRYIGEDYWVIENIYKDLHPLDRAFFDGIN
jgi:hypothetical protein